MAQKLRVLWWKNKIQNQQNGDRKVAIFYTIEVRYFFKNFPKIDRTFCLFRFRLWIACPDHHNFVIVIFAAESEVFIAF